MDENKIVAAILATAMTDNRWTQADANDLIRRYQAILQVLGTMPSAATLDPAEAGPDSSEALRTAAQEPPPGERR
jgi:hypothetical protein